MIREVTGDILLSKAQVIAHGVAPSDHFDSGLALSLRERWPALAKDFRHYCQQSHPKPGALWAWGGPDAERGSVRIVNLMTQEPSERAGGHPGKATLHNVGHALKALAQLARSEGYESIALPRLATGVGGLDWSDVRPLIDKYLGDLGVPVILYVTYQKGIAVDEKLPVTV